MAKVTASTDIEQAKPEQQARFTELALEDIVSQVNGNLTFQENIKCKLLSVTFGAANVDVAVSHGLGRVPAGYLVSSLSSACAVYNGSSASTASVIYLKASAPSTVGLILF